MAFAAAAGEAGAHTRQRGGFGFRLQSLRRLRKGVAHTAGRTRPAHRRSSRWGRHRAAMMAGGAIAPLSRSR